MEQTIDAAWERRAELNSTTADAATKDAVAEAIADFFAEPKNQAALDAYLQLRRRRRA